MVLGNLYALGALHAFNFRDIVLCNIRTGDLRLCLDDLAAPLEHVQHFALFLLVHEIEADPGHHDGNTGDQQYELLSDMHLV